MIKIYKRKEVNYLLTSHQKKEFLVAISSHIQNDIYNTYKVCNIYYDTTDSNYNKSSVKRVYNEKMCIRSYGMASANSNVFVELRKNHNGFVYKRQIGMTLDEITKYISGIKKMSETEEEIDYFLHVFKGTLPSIYIAYDRESFISKRNSDTKITFDSNIIFRDTDISLKSNVYGNPLFNDNKINMNIKYTGDMPLWFTDALRTFEINELCFSKYGKAIVINQSL